MTQTTITYSLEEFLKEFKSDINKQFAEVNKRFDTFEAEVDKRLDTFEAKVDKRFDTFEAEVDKRLDTFEAEVDKHFDTLETDIKELKGDVNQLKVDLTRVDTELKFIRENSVTQKNQLWALIAILATAVAGIVVAGGKYVFFS